MKNNNFRRLSVSILMTLSMLLGLSGAYTGKAEPSANLTVCSVGCDHATIQGALNAAKHEDVIQLLTASAHTEYDIVVNKSVTIEGLGETTTIVQAAATPGAAPNRVFYVLDNLTVTFKDMTIRHGFVAGNGGGIYNEGSDIILTDVQVSANQSYAGGGIYHPGGKLTLNDVLVSDNSSGGKGSGIFNEGVLIVNDSTININDGSDNGGGIFNSGSTTINDSQISWNEVKGSSFGYLYGGGIFNQGTMTITGSTITNNLVVGGFNTISNGGGGIYSESGKLQVLNSTIHANKVQSDSRGGGMFLRSGEVQIEGTTISKNSASGSFTSTGGLIIESAIVTVINSTISGNTGDAGGGMQVRSGSVDISQTTFEGNVSNYGGGLYVCNSTADLNLTNVTISNNEASYDGGGIYVCSAGALSLANVTVTNNRSDADDEGDGDGGGLYLATYNDDEGTAFIRNSIISGNEDLTDFPGPRAADCYGEVDSQGYNLIGTLGYFLTTSLCQLSGDTTGNQLGEDVKLDVLGDNGGDTQTHALLAGSAAINAGNPDGCLGADQEMLEFDQRGGYRSDRCDIGAYEYEAQIGPTPTPTPTVTPSSDAKLYLPMLRR